MPTNHIELRVFGLRRSGNHAILSWIFDSIEGPVVHLNNVRTRHLDPYHTFGTVIAKGLPFSKCYAGKVELLKHLVRRPTRMVFRGNDPRVNLSYIRNFPQKDCLIYSYENCRLGNTSFRELELERERLLGRSNNIWDVLILRDPANTFASHFAKRRVNCDSDARATLVALFKEYATEYLGQSNFLCDRPKIVINYNKWYTSAEYRMSIARTIGFKCSGEAYEFVPNQGHGSSFTGTAYSGNARSMGVLERWQTFVDDDNYRSMFDDPELRALSREIFGAVAPPLDC